MVSVGGPRMLVGLYVVEFLTLASALTLQRRGERGFTQFLANPAGLLWAALTLALAVSLIGLAILVMRLPSPRALPLAVPVVINLCSMILVFAVAEGAVRWLAWPSLQGPVVAGTVLLPYRWEDVAGRSKASLQRVAAGQSYLVPDRDLGWTIGASRTSPDYNREGVAQYFA